MKTADVGLVADVRSEPGVSSVLASERQSDEARDLSVDDRERSGGKTSMGSDLEGLGVLLVRGSGGTDDTDDILSVRNWARSVLSVGLTAMGEAVAEDLAAVLKSLMRASISLILSSMLSQNSTGVLTLFSDSRKVLKSLLLKLSLRGESLRLGEGGLSGWSLLIPVGSWSVVEELPERALSASEVTESAQLSLDRGVRRTDSSVVPPLWEEDVPAVLSPALGLPSPVIVLLHPLSVDADTSMLLLLLVRKSFFSIPDTVGPLSSLFPSFSALVFATSPLPVPPTAGITASTPGPKSDLSCLWASTNTDSIVFEADGVAAVLLGSVSIPPIPPPCPPWRSRLSSAPPSSCRRLFGAGCSPL